MFVLEYKSASYILHFHFQVMVLFLCTVSYSKNNEQVVERIKSLTNSDQREIMFYIQNTIASINTNAIADGTMTSGKE